MTIRVFAPWVFCRVPDSEERVTSGGIIVPGNARGRPDKAVIEAIDPARGAAIGLEVGDTVCFDAYAIKTVYGAGMLANAQGTPVANPGDLFVIDDDDILYVELGE